MVLLAQPDSIWLKPVAGTGEIVEQIMQARFSIDAGQPLWTGVCGEAFRTQKPAVNNDILNSTQGQPWQQAARETGVAACVAVPLIKAGESIGVLLFFVGKSWAKDEEIVALMVRIAENVSFALDNFERAGEKARADAQKERLARMLAALSATNEAIVRATSRDELFELVCEAAAKGGRFNSTSILLARPDSDHTDMVAVAGPTAANMRRVKVSINADHPEGRGLCGNAGSVPGSATSPTSSCSCRRWATGSPPSRASNRESVIGASVVVWIVHALTLSGVRNASVVNVIVTVAKIVPDPDLHRDRGRRLLSSGCSPRTSGAMTPVWGTTMDQVKNMMLGTVWVFIGIEGAVVYSNSGTEGRRPRDGARIPRACSRLLLAVNLLSYGLMAQADIAGLSDPSMAGLLETQVGSWEQVHLRRARGLVARGTDRLGAAGRRDPAAAGPGTCSRRRSPGDTDGAPVSALWLTNLCVQAMLLWTLVNENTYTDLIYLATSLILLPYLWSAAFQVKLALTGETYGDGHARTRDLLVGLVALGYAVWLVYAGGWEYVLVAGLFYLVGTALFVWARMENHLPLLSGVERALVGVVAAGSVVAVVGLAQGWVTV